MIKLSVIIITLNEERNIRRCLASIKALADEILILDSFSTDGTKEIAESYGARVVQKKFEGYVAARRDVERLAENDYILAIDADESLSEELHRSIVEIKKNWQKDGYCIARKTNYCGKWINHSGWYPDRKLRIYKRGSGEWMGKYVHEKYALSSEKTTGKLQGDLLHYSYYQEKEHWTRAEKYAHLAALELFEDGKSTSIFQAYFKAAVKFLRDYVKNLGFLDGKTGYTICKITAWGTYKKYTKLFELNKNDKNS
jgi:glycosyltransferase involved in cell wall biosynthesis